MKPQWIPVGQGLPEEAEAEYLVTLLWPSGHTSVSSEMFLGDHWLGYTSAPEPPSGAVVTAWMPLPAPYRP